MIQGVFSWIWQLWSVGLLCVFEGCHYLLVIVQTIATTQPDNCFSGRRHDRQQRWGGNNLNLGIFNWYKPEGQLGEVFAVESQQHLLPFAGTSEKHLRPFKKGTVLSHRHSGSKLIELCRVTWSLTSDLRSLAAGCYTDSWLLQIMVALLAFSMRVFIPGLTPCPKVYKMHSQAS